MSCHIISYVISHQITSYHIIYILVDARRRTTLGWPPNAALSRPGHAQLAAGHPAGQAVVQPATLPAAFVAGSKAKIARGKGKVAGKSSGGAPIPHILLTRVHSLQNEYYSHRRKYAIILVLKF